MVAVYWLFLVSYTTEPEVLTLTKVFVLHSWVRHVTLTVPCPNQVCTWELENNSVLGILKKVFW